MPEISPYKESNAEWDHAAETFAFLETGALISTNLLRSSYVQLSLTLMELKMLMKKGIYK